MTNAEAIAIIRKEYLCVDRDCDIEKNCGRCDLMMPSKEPILEAYKMAIQALEQEPCEDAVSRKALISHIEKQSREWGEDYDAQQILGDIEDMPSVKPQTGHWIIMGDRYIKCSECGHITKTESPDIYNFCMVCGANMSENPTGLEPQETKPEISSYYGLRSYVRERSKE
jgi:hypothetical protein